MAYTIFCGELPRVFDTLPAMKARYSPADSGDKQLYTTARFYFEGECLKVSLMAFERTPDPQSRLVFAITGNAQTLVYCNVGPQEAGAFLLAAHPVQNAWAPRGTALPLAPPQYFSGADEQGWYWGAALTLAPDALGPAGIRPAADATCRAALLKMEGGRLQAASHEGPVLDPARFEACRAAFF